MLLLDRPVAPVLAALAAARHRGRASISAPSYPELGHALLVCATETKSHADIETYERALRAALALPHDVRGAA